MERDKGIMVGWWILWLVEMAKVTDQCIATDIREPLFRDIITKEINYKKQK